MAMKDKIVSLVLKAKDLISPDANKSRTSVKGLSDALNDAGKAGQQTSDHFEQVADSAEDAAEGIQDTHESSERAESRFGRLLRRLAELASSGFRRASSSAADANKEIRDSENAANTADGGVAKLTRRLVALASTYLSLQGIKNAFLGIIGLGADLEKFRAQLDQAMGSIEEGERATQWIKEFASETPYSIAQVTEGFLSLKAFGIDPMNGSYEALAQQAAKLGGSQETLNGIILAAGQAWAKQKLQGEEILQLVERGVPVWDLLTRATGKSTIELQKMSEAGQLGRKEIALLIEEMGRAADGSLEGQASTLYGLWDRLKSLWGEFVAMIADSGLTDYVKTTLSDLITGFKQLAADGALQRWAQSISDAFVGLLDALKRFSTTAVGDIETFGERAASSLDTVTKGFRITGAAATLFVTGLKATFNTAVMAVAGFSAKVTELSAKAWGFLGFDEIAENGRRMAQSFSDTFDEYAAKLAQNNETIKQAAADLADAMLSEAQRGAEGSQKTHEEAAEKTGEALVAAVEAAEQQSRLLRSQVDEINAAVVNAAASTEAAWAAYYEASGSAQAAALANLNAAIQEENRLRVEASNTTLEYNNAVAESERFVAQLATEKAQAQAAAAQQARAELQRLGVDVGLAFDGISSNAATSIAALKTVAEEIKAIGPESDQAARAFEQGVTAALRNVSTAEEFEAIRSQIQELRNQELIDGATAAAALDLIRQKAEELNKTPMTGGADGLVDSLNKAKGAAEALSSAITADNGEAEHYRKRKSRLDGFSQALTNARETVTALSAAARQLFEQRLLGDDFTVGAQTASEKLAEARREVEALHSASIRMQGNTFGSWFNDVALNAARVKAEFYGQQVALETLVRSIENGSYSLDQLSRMSATAAQRFELLDDQSLSQLHAAIDTARQKVESLNQSAASTLASLRNELDQMAGDLASVQQRTYEQQRQQLEQRLKEAQESGAQAAARDAQEALKVAEELHRRKMQQIRDEEAARRKAAQEEQIREAARAEAERHGAPQSAPSSTGGQRIILQAPNGREVAVQTNDTNGFLAALEAAGLRSAL